MLGCSARVSDRNFARQLRFARARISS